MTSHFWGRSFLRTCLHGGGLPWIGQVTHGGSPHLSLNVIKLKWEIIRTGRLPHLSGLPHLPGVPHLHVNRPLVSHAGVLRALSCVSFPWKLEYERINWGDYFFVFKERLNSHFTWSSEPREGLAACSAKGVPSFLSYFNLSFCPVPGFEPATSRSTVKRTTDWANPAERTWGRKAWLRTDKAIRTSV